MNRQEIQRIHKLNFSSKAIRRFHNSINESGAPDIDSAQAILPEAAGLYQKLGVPKEDAQKWTKKTENTLLGGTATQQTEASEALSCLQEAALRSIQE